MLTNMLPLGCDSESENRPGVHLGSISTVRKNFGFIKSASFASDIFFHFSACVDDELAAGDAVEFVLDAEQQPGKKTAAQVWRSSQHHSLTEVSSCHWYGCIAFYNASGRRGSGVLRFMDHQGKPQHLTFSSADLDPLVSQASLVPGSLVSFKILTNMRQKSLTEAAGAPHPAAVHAYKRATQIQMLTADVKVNDAAWFEIFVLASFLHRSENNLCCEGS